MGPRRVFRTVRISSLMIAEILHSSSSGNPFVARLGDSLDGGIRERTAYGAFWPHHFSPLPPLAVLTFFFFFLTSGETLQGKTQTKECSLICGRSWSIWDSAE
eukprot:Selendium_serpulae@DN494_c0_g1_i1.p1